MKRLFLVLLLVTCFCSAMAWARSESFKENILDPGPLKPVDSVLKVKIGDQAPDFSLPSLTGGKISLGQFKGQKNVVLSFIPAAWTPVCSDQWPGYNIAKDWFEKNNTIILGISVDNLPTLFSWTNQMGKLWFPVLSDFWPHGKTAAQYGVLRTDGTSERALIVIDQQGIIRYVDVHDINHRPKLEILIKELEKLNR